MGRLGKMFSYRKTPLIFPSTGGQPVSHVPPIADQNVKRKRLATNPRPSAFDHQIGSLPRV